MQQNYVAKLVLLKAENCALLDSPCKQPRARSDCSKKKQTTVCSGLATVIYFDILPEYPGF